jgi:hypothetical protein
MPESVGEAVAVTGGVLPAGDAVGDEGVEDDGGDTEADADGEAGAVPDGLVCGAGDTADVADGVGTMAFCWRAPPGAGQKPFPVPP